MSRDRSFFSPVGTATPVRADGTTSPSSPRGESHAVDMSTSSSAASRPSPSFPVDARLGAKSAGPSPASLGSMAPILAYCASSILMTVVNKYVLSGQHFSMNLVVLLIQSAVGVIVVLGARQAKLIQIREWNTTDARNWAPISFLLVMVIWTGSKALQYLAIPVYTIFKNLTIILIAYGEVIWFGGKITRLTMLSFLLMVLSSVIAAWSDISRLSLLSSLSMPHSPDFLDAVTKDPNTGADVHAYDPMRETKMKLNELSGSLGGPSNGINDEVFEGLGGFGALNSGYVWMALNCAVSAAYVLAMRKRIKLTGFKDWDTMYFNNLLSVPCLLIMSFLVEDWSRESINVNFPPETRTSLLAAIVFSGACAVFISYTTAWCIRVTSSTTYSMVGALNKLPIALSGAIFQPLDAGTGGGIFVGFLSGIVYAVAKNKQAQANAAATSSAATGLGLGERGSANQKAGVIPMHSMPLMADHREGGSSGSRPGSSGGDDYNRDRKD